jgi:hypothetical protein
MVTDLPVIAPASSAWSPATISPLSARSKSTFGAASLDNDAYDIAAQPRAASEGAVRWVRAGSTSSQSRGSPRFESEQQRIDTAHRSLRNGARQQGRF